MPDKLRNDYRSAIIFGLMAMMLLSLFFSRSALSISMIAFIVFSIINPRIKTQVRHFFSVPLFWGMSLLFFIPLISGIWSEDKQEWSTIMLIKLPLLFFPLTFAGITLSKKQWRWLAVIFIALITAGTIWSMFNYIPDAANINEGYLRSKSIITPLDNDHIRFSWLTCVAILLIPILIYDRINEKKIMNWVLTIVASWLIIYLHILAARMGLVIFYLMLVIILFFLAVKKIKPIFSFVLLIMLIITPILAYKTIPSFHNRAKYFVYEYEYFRKAQYLPGSNDAVRIISLKAGWNIMSQNFLTGIGFGDVIYETKKWYDESYPEMLETDKIYPSNEALMYGAGTGILGILVFLFAILIPFFSKTANRLPWILICAGSVVSLISDIGLEVQFGVFIYSFILLWFYCWFNIEKENKFGRTKA